MSGTTSSGYSSEARPQIARSIASLAAALSVALAASIVAAPQAPAESGRPPAGARNGEGWFGLALPPPLGQPPAVLIGNRGPRPVMPPAGDPQVTELTAASIRSDLEAIVGFSASSRRDREIGNGQLWGRITGFPSGERTVAWAAEQFRQAGIEDVRVQTFAQDEGASLWLPLSWEVRLMGETGFGPGSADVVLESAMPVGPGGIDAGTLTAPLVFVGSANESLQRQVDVEGKIAVQLVIPQAHMVFERDPVVPRARALFERGAVAVLNLLRQPGNERARDFSNCGGPCFNIGGRDGRFVERALDAAAKAGQTVRATLTLQSETRRGLAAQNAVAAIPGRRPSESIIVNAHADAWFDGAGDNADGLAVMIALARHFAREANRPERTLVFVASAGHHTPGLNGPRAFVAANAGLARAAVMVLNIEHVAQRNFSMARSVAADGYREAIADSGEAPIVAGVTNRSPLLDTLFAEGVERYGVNFVSGSSDMESGETVGYRALDVARLTVMQAPPLYHTSGEVQELISTPGLERIARFFAWFLKAVDKAASEAINPG